MPKRILIAIPTARNIEPDTFKSIYDLQVPEGYTTEFQYFYGYNVDQVRNLIADWVVKGYDYLFSVDSDIAFAPDTLAKMLAHDVDMVSGLYIQRKPGEHILEIYEPTATGGSTHMDYSKLRGKGLTEVVGCGFGCVLVKAEVFKAIGYPHFKYHSALDHRYTVSEDTDFCIKARRKGFKIYADPSILCSHTGSWTFKVGQGYKEDTRTAYELLADKRLFPAEHTNFLKYLKQMGVEPKVVYDIGACVLHWTKEAKDLWPNADYYAFEAVAELEQFYKTTGNNYHIGLLGDADGVVKHFYQNPEHPAGSSMYRETAYPHLYQPTGLVQTTLDTAVAAKNWPKPDLVKIDVQGAEMDIVKGALATFSDLKHLILELQVTEYNAGAPLKDTVIAFMEQQGWRCAGCFCDYGPDGDYYFSR